MWTSEKGVPSLEYFGQWLPITIQCQLPSKHFENEIHRIQTNAEIQKVPWVKLKEKVKIILCST